MTYTCAHAHARAIQTHTHRQNHTQMPHSPSPSPSSTLSLCCCQIKALKAGHKGDCVAAARAETCTAAKPIADQMRVLKMIEQLAGAADWRGVAAQERAGRAVAASVASFVYSTLGNVHCSQGGFSKAIEYPGDCKSGGGRPGGGLGCSYQSQGDYAKDIEYHVQHLEIAKEAATHISRKGTSARPSITSRSDWRSQRRLATGRGRARCTGTSVRRKFKIDLYFGCFQGFPWYDRLGPCFCSCTPFGRCRETWTGPTTATLALSVSDRRRAQFVAGAARDEVREANPADCGRAPGLQGLLPRLQEPQEASQAHD